MNKEDAQGCHEFCKILLTLSQCNANFSQQNITKNPQNISSYNSIDALIKANGGWSRRSGLDSLFPTKYEYKIKILHELLPTERYNNFRREFNQFHYSSYRENFGDDDVDIKDDIEYIIGSRTRYDHDNTRNTAIDAYRKKYKSNISIENKKYESIPNIPWSQLWTDTTNVAPEIKKFHRLS